MRDQLNLINYILLVLYNIFDINIKVLRLLKHNTNINWYMKTSLFESY